MRLFTRSTQNQIVKLPILLFFRFPWIREQFLCLLRLCYRVLRCNSNKEIDSDMKLVEREDLLKTKHTQWKLSLSRRQTNYSFL